LGFFESPGVVSPASRAGGAGSSSLAVLAPDEAEPLVALALDDALPVAPPAWLDASGSLVSFAAAAAAAATLAILRSFLSSVRTI
jgi:hypothetical protein